MGREVESGDGPLRLAVWALVALLGVSAVALYTSGAHIGVVIVLGVTAGALISWLDLRKKARG